MTPNQQTQSSRFPAVGRKTGLPLSVLLALAGTTLSHAQAVDSAKEPVAPVAPITAEETIELEEFKVVGIRGSLTKAIEIKRDSIPMVDSIVAEDIGKFPDNNVVEALQRVPGVQVTDYARGELATVTIRGLPDSSTLINGRNVFTASGLAVQLADVPASLLSRVDIFKTRSASLFEAGLAGIIDIRTHRPFDFAGDKVSVATRAIYQEQADEWGGTVSGLYSKRWNTNAGKFGALINVSYLKNKYRDQSVTPGAMVPFITGTPPSAAAGVWGPYERIFLTKPGVSQNPIWTPGLDDGLPTAPGSTLRMNNVDVPYVLSRDAIFAADNKGEVERPAASLALQWEPSKGSLYTFEVFYDGYRNENYNSLFFSFVDAWWANGANPSSTVTLHPGTNIVKSRKPIGDVFTFTSGDYSVSKTDSIIYALNGQWDISPDFQLRADASYQKSEFENEFFAMRFNKGAIRRDISVDFNEKDGLPAFRFLDDPATANVNESSLTNPADWVVAELYDNADKDDGSAGTLTVDGDYKPTDWWIITKLSFGARYDSREASESQRRLDPPGFLGQSVANFPGLWSINSDFFDGRANIPTSWIAANGEYIYDHADEIRRRYSVPQSGQLKLTESFNVKEINMAAYVQADFRTTLAGRKLDGQVGARFVSVDTEVNFGTDSVSPSKTKLLPSIMVRYDITNDLKARASYGETLRRPNFVDLNPVINYVADVTNIGYGTATGGNPNLEPTESKNYDLSLEYYFDKSNAVFITGFRRDIEGLVIPYRNKVRYNNYDYILSQPDNASNGKLTGVEIGGVYFPDYLPSFLKGLGVQASYTMLDSEQDVPVLNEAGQTVRIRKTKFFAVSDNSYNVVLAYERAKFSARLSYAWREGFLHHNEAPLFANPLGVYNSDEANMNLQLSYNITKNLVITLDGTNLTDEIYHSHYGSGANDETTNNFGNWIVSRSFAVGVRYSF